MKAIQSPFERQLMTKFVLYTELSFATLAEKHFILWFCMVMHQPSICTPFLKTFVDFLETKCLLFSGDSHAWMSCGIFLAVSLGILKKY